MKGSILELKNRLRPNVYKRIKPQVAKTDWQIVAWDHTKLVIRVERENLRFNPTNGRLMDRVPLTRGKGR